MDKQETTMQIYRSEAVLADKTPEMNFMGDVTISGYFEREAPSRLAGATVHFAPGSRTPWKVNPLGQTLIVTHGVGWAQSDLARRGHKRRPEPVADLRV